MMLRGLTAILAVVVTAVLLLLPSCSGESPAYNRENIKATWIADTYDGVLQDERNCTVITFQSSGTVVYEGVLSLGNSEYQWGTNNLRYDTYCCDLSISGTYEGLYGYTSPMDTYQEYTFAHSQDSLMTLALESMSLGGVEVTPEYSTVTMRKIPKTYAAADSLYGVWQFNTMNGGGFSDCRIQFGTEGALTMLRRTGENEWEPMGASEDYYRLYSDFLALTVYDNDIFGTSGKWDVRCFLIDSVSVVNGYMSLRSSGDIYGLSFISSN